MCGTSNFSGPSEIEASDTPTAQQKRHTLCPGKWQFEPRGCWNCVFFLETREVRLFMFFVSRKILVGYNRLFPLMN